MISQFWCLATESLVDVIIFFLIGINQRDCKNAFICLVQIDFAVSCACSQGRDGSMIPTLGRTFTILGF